MLKEYLEKFKNNIIEYAHYIDYALWLLFFGLMFVSSGWLSWLFALLSALCLVGAIMKPAKKIDKKINDKIKKGRKQ